MTQSDETTATSTTRAPVSPEPAARAADALPPPPRPITPIARRHAWGDLHVRFWWLSAIGVIIAIGYFSTFQINRALRDRQVIRNGIPVQTVIQKAGDRDIVGHSTLREGSTPVVLVGKMPDGTERTFAGTVGPGPGYLRVGGPLAIRVDPNDPQVWTDRQEVTPWHRELAVSLMFLPLIIGLLMGAVIMRRRILNVWRHGVPVEGTVVELRHSAWAPLSRLVRYSLANSSDRRIFSTLAPARAAPAKGETIELLAPPKGAPKPTILARLYRE